MGTGTMLGFSLTKLLFTILVIVAVWRGFQLVQRLQKAPTRRPQRRFRVRRDRRPPAPAMDLVPCPKCGAYVTPGTDCPSVERCRLRAAEGGERQH